MIFFLLLTAVSPYLIKRFRGDGGLFGVRQKQSVRSFAQKTVCDSPSIGMDGGQ